MAFCGFTISRPEFTRHAEQKKPLSGTPGWLPDSGSNGHGSGLLEDGEISAEIFAFPAAAPGGRIRGKGEIAVKGIDE